MLNPKDDDNNENGIIDHRADALIDRYLKIRDARAKLSEVYKTADKPLQEREAVYEGKLFAFLDSIAAKSLRVTNGVLITSTSSTSASLTDKDAFMRHVIGTEQWELLERRANAQACIDVANECGELPPGVKLNTRRILKVTK